MYKLAAKRMGWSMDTLFRASGFSHNSTNKRLYRQMGYGGEFIGFEKYMYIAGLAGIPRGYAVCLYARLMVPKEYRHYIGCTVKPGRRRRPGKMDKAEFREKAERYRQEIQRGVDFPLPQV